MRVPAVLALALALAPALAGCVAQVLDEGPVRVAGNPDGTVPTNVYLKAYVERDGGLSVVAFDRADWYVAGLEKEFVKLDWIAVEGVPQLDREVVVATVVSPEELEAKYRFDRMGVDASERKRLDAEWDARLKALAEKAEQDGGVDLPMPVVLP